MKIKLLLSLGFLILASCKEATQNIVVAGDSWASFVCNYKSLDKALNKVGITNSAANSSCVATTLPGLRADEWMEMKPHQATRLALQDPKVKVLYLSIGGNDVINYWNRSMNATEENETLDKVVQSVEAVIKNYQELRPDIKILLSGYDFPRFTADNPVAHYREAYEEMGRPTAFELNSAILRFSAKVSKLADQKNVFYIQHYGLMHYYLGNSEGGLAPMTTLSPELISAPTAMDQTGGDVNLQTDPAGLLEIKVGNQIVGDAFHLNRYGFDRLADHAVFHYLKDWLKGAP